MPRLETFNREQVLQNAMQVFWDRGYHATSMQDIVEATGLNRSSVYNSFGGKMALYQSSLKLYIENTQNNFNQALSKSDNALENIRDIFESFLPEITSDSRGCMSMNCKSEMAADADIKKWLERTQEGTLNLFQKLIEKGQQQGVINKHQDGRVYAWHVFNSFQGYRMTGILEKNPIILKQIINNSLNILK